MYHTNTDIVPVNDLYSMLAFLEGGVTIFFLLGALALCLRLYAHIRPHLTANNAVFSPESINTLTCLLEETKHLQLVTPARELAFARSTGLNLNAIVKYAENKWVEEQSIVSCEEYWAQEEIDHLEEMEQMMIEPTDDPTTEDLLDHHREIKAWDFPHEIVEPVRCMTCDTVLCEDETSGGQCLKCARNEWICDTNEELEEVRGDRPVGRGGVPDADDGHEG